MNYNLMKYNLKKMNKVYLLQVYFKAYCDKYKLTKDEFLKIDSKKKILKSILDLHYDLDNLPVEEGLRELEDYINDKNL